MPPRVESATLISTTESRPAGNKQPASSRHGHLESGLLHFLGYRHGARLAVLGTVKMRLTTEDGSSAQAFGFIPARTSGQADQSNRVCVVVAGFTALFQQLVDLLQGEKIQLGLVGLDLANIGERILARPRTEADQLGEHRRQVALFMVDRMR